MRNVTLGLIIGAALLVSGSLSLKATENKMKLWYDKPADEWMKSLPLGNGRLGVIIYGGIETETLALNESTMWSGNMMNISNVHSEEKTQSSKKAIF